MKTAPHQNVSTSEFGLLKDGRSTTLYTLSNSNGVSASITNYGATLVSLKCPDKKGKIGDIILGFDNVQGYTESDAYLGATVGRFANRIANGKFAINDEHFQLAINNGTNHLHGGLNGFDKRVWHAEVLREETPAIRFSLFSPDGDEHYPGNLTIHVIYRLDNNNTLTINIDASTDKPTPISMTNHSYFNLKGQGSVLNHFLTLNADSYTPLDNNQVPTGEIADVAGTPLDFRTPHKLGERIDEEHEQIAIASGYDHNFVTKADGNSTPTLIATLSEPYSGRVLKISTTAPGAQLYTANFLDGSVKGRGVIHERRHAVCIEPQNFPDAPNKPQFPNCILQPGKKYRHTMLFNVSCQN